MATAGLLQYASSALPQTRDRDRSTSRPGRPGRPAHRNIQIQPTLRTINEIIQALRERPLPDLDSTRSVTAYTNSRLPAVDPVTLAFHRALHAFRPLTPLYAVVPYAEAFNWSEIVLKDDEQGTVRAAEREWYVVAFRSRRRRGLSEEEAERLYKADRAAHEEAVARKILMYWFGAPFPSASEQNDAPIDDDLVGVNLATCIWNSRRDAIEAMRGEKHREAAKLASSLRLTLQVQTTYETYQLERYIIRKERGELGISVRDWHGGETQAPPSTHAMSPTPVDDAPVLGAFRITGGRSFYDTASVEIIDQLLLPHQEVWEEVSTIEGAFDAIKTMKIRGAPAIASLASLGIAAELLNLLNNRPCPSFPAATLSAPPAELLKLLLDRTAYLLTSRPTAVNLREALSRIEASAKAEASAQGATAESLAKKVIDVAVGVWVEDKERCEKIGKNGAKWILEKLEREGTIQKGEKIAVLTGYGTALGVITSLHKQNRLEHAYFAQTGPYQQGARLTAVELASLGAPNTMVCDTAIGALLGEKRVHLFVAGADRIASNGDTANKISTYQISLLAHHPHPHSPNPPVPVLVAAPLTTLDLSMRSGREIEIEQRPSWEACTVRGRVVDPAKVAKGQMVSPAKEGEKVQVETVLVTPPGTNAWNPAFDVTPASLIEGIVTEVGVAEKKEGENEYDLRAFVEEKTKA
ncbi:hypothetical protein BJY59DRAFT_720778 [Rhodotorula toruloides]